MDLISRQAAIDRINKQREHLKPDIDERDAIGDAAYRVCAEFIERLPSAQSLDPCETCLHKGKGWDEDPCDGCTGTESKYKPDNGWIPVSERLPERNKMDSTGEYREAYLVTTGFMTFTARFNEYGYWVLWGYQQVLKNIIAWMPLPSPYEMGGG